jgi:propionyl-CoA carboxylase beta chain
MGVWGGAGAAKIIYRREIGGAQDPAAEEELRTRDYEEKFNHPFRAAERGFIDDVIEASQTRPNLIRALSLFASKQAEGPKRKHGNVPL